MTFKIYIDKSASLVAGIDPTSDSLMFEIPASSIPEEVRPMVVRQLTTTGIDAGLLRVSHLPGERHGWKAGGPESIPLRVLANATVEDALDLVTRWARREQEREVWYEQAVAEKQAEDKVKAEQQAVQKAQQDDEWRAALMAGAVEIVKRIDQTHVVLSRENNTRSLEITPEMVPLMEAWDAEQAAKAAREALRKERARELAEARKVSGQKTYEWDIEQGSIDISTEPGIPYDSDYRARNWVASVSFCATSPGNLDRKFWDGKGKFLTVPSDLSVGQYLEGGSKDKKGRKSSDYVRVLEVTDQHLLVRDSDKPGPTPPAIVSELAELARSRELVATIRARHVREDKGLPEQAEGLVDQYTCPPTPAAEVRDLSRVPTSALEAELARRAAVPVP